MLIFALSGCTSFSLHQPEVHLINLTLGPTRGLSQALDVELLVTNPNTVPLELKAMHYRLRVEGYELASGISVEPLSVPAGGETSYTVPVRVHLLAGMDLLRTLLASPREALSYELEAELEPRGSWRSWHIRRADRFVLKPR